MDNRSDLTENVKVTCPYCRSTDTEFFSLFGQQLLTVEYYCNSCHTPFEHVKDDDVINLALVHERNNNYDHDK